MYSIKFPDMFQSAKTNLVSDKEAAMNNLKLLLLSDRFGLFGDPYYGTSFKRVIFEQNNKIIRDLVTDEIYEVIHIFMPQLKVERKNIQMTSDGTNLYANITCIYRPDGTTDMLNLNMTANDRMY